MDDRHLQELAEWLENNIDIEAGIPVIFSNGTQDRLEQLLTNGYVWG